jgi:hypothetical protein
MDSVARKHFYSAVESAELIEDPFPHLYATDVFPSEFYQRLIDSLPALESYKQYSEQYSARYSLDITADSAKGLKDVAGFWIGFESWLNSTELLNALFRKFGDRMKTCYELRKKWINDATTPDGVIVSSQSLLCRDFENFALEPHTDAAPKLVVGIFYFPKDESLIEFGTSLYRPKDPSVKDFMSKRMERDQFDLVKTFENRPNSFAAFLKTDNSFHGVEDRPHSNIGRDVLFWIPRLGNIPRRARIGLDQEVEARESPNLIPASVFTPAREMAS